MSLSVGDIVQVSPDTAVYPHLTGDIGVVEHIGMWCNEPETYWVGIKFPMQSMHWLFASDVKKVGHIE